MKSAPRLVVASLLGLALLAGPAAAACMDCCPRAHAPLSVGAPQGCCGDCAPTIHRAPDLASLSVKGVTNGLDFASAAIGPGRPISAESTLRPLAIHTLLPSSAPTALPAPLRL